MFIHGAWARPKTTSTHTHTHISSKVPWDYARPYIISLSQLKQSRSETDTLWVIMLWPTTLDYQPFGMLICHLRLKQIIRTLYCAIHSRSSAAFCQHLVVKLVCSVQSASIRFYVANCTALTTTIPPYTLEYCVYRVATESTHSPKPCISNDDVMQFYIIIECF